MNAVVGMLFMASKKANHLLDYPEENLWLSVKSMDFDEFSQEFFIYEIYVNYVSI